MLSGLIEWPLAVMVAAGAWAYAARVVLWTVRREAAGNWHACDVAEFDDGRCG